MLSGGLLGLLSEPLPAGRQDMVPWLLGMASAAGLLRMELSSPLLAGGT